ncbi:MAG: hypothetical protein B7Y88_07110 [Sphingomonadales bacterium 32-64-17]|jgi:hypothetical protein|nr:MAG: hypothetical protein B7Y88_07110 [Sphingomonadales bacterium 32-64-17]
MSLEKLGRRPREARKNIMPAIDPSEQQNHPAQKVISTTKHPALCLLGFVVFLTSAALAVHFTFQAIF